MNTRLAMLLGRTLPPEVYRFASHAAAPSLMAQADAAGWRAFHLDGSQIASKADFLHVCARTMALPDYFGHNWDALQDSLRDLSWAPAQAGYLVLYDGAANFATAQPGEFATAVDVLRTACDFWRNTETPMAVLLRGSGRAAREVPRL